MKNSHLYRMVDLKTKRRCDCGHLEQNHKEFAGKNGCMACGKDEYYHDFSESLESVVWIQRELERIWDE